MNEIFSRNELLWGEKAQIELSKKHVVVFGLGGVGAYAAESLCRSGIGQLTLIDFDNVAISNINRQLLALNSTIGQSKVDLMKARLLDINPDIKINIYKDFYTAELSDEIFSSKVDFVVDAIDTLKSKIELLVFCYTNEIPVITSLGAGNRQDPTQLYVADISEINPKKCPFSRNVLIKLKENAIVSGITAIASTEKPKSLEKIMIKETIHTQKGEEIALNKYTPGSVPYIPPIVGYMMTGIVIQKLINGK